MTVSFYRGEEFLENIGSSETDFFKSPFPLETGNWPVTDLHACRHMHGMKKMMQKPGRAPKRQQLFWWRLESRPKLFLIKPLARTRTAPSTFAPQFKGLLRPRQQINAGKHPVRYKSIPFLYASPALLTLSSPRQPVNHGPAFSPRGTAREGAEMGGRGDEAGRLAETV